MEGSDIDGEGSGDYSGHAVSLSGDGSILAIGMIDTATIFFDYVSSPFDFNPSCILLGI